MSQHGDQPDQPAPHYPPPYYGTAYGTPESNPHYPYPNMPDAGQVVDRPRQVRLATLLLWTGIVLSVASSLLSLTMLDQVVDVALERQPSSASALDRDTLRSIAVASAIVGLVVNVAITALLTIFIGKGHNWARIVYTIFAAFGVVARLIGIANQPPLLLASSALASLLAIVVVVLLYQRDSNAYFRSR